MNRHANGSARRTLFVSALIVASLWWATVALAQASERQYDFDIAPLPLSQALLQFTKQTKLQLFYSPDDVEEDQLIAGDQLVFFYIVRAVEKLQLRLLRELQQRL